jgi:hypothetical protein
MSDGKKFVKSDVNLTPEQRLDELERKYSVIQERIQKYNQVLVEFANINSDLNAHKKRIDSLEIELESWICHSKQIINEIIGTMGQQSKNNGLMVNTLEEQKNSHQKLSHYVQECFGTLYRDSELLKVQVHDVDIEHIKTRDFSTGLEKTLLDLKKFILDFKDNSLNLKSDFNDFKRKTDQVHADLKSQMDHLLGSFQEMPQFNEWATKIYIKVCNEINDKQKAFYLELDKRSQQLKEQLASDPYTAESVKTILKSEMDKLAMDGKNAYLKAANAAQQIQLLEKKVENINLILKKYELNK